MDQISKNNFLEILARKSAAESIPSTVVFELSYGCNYKCIHCLNPTHKALPHELRTEEIFRILSEITQLGGYYVNLTGGELFTRPDIFEILTRAKDLGLILGINSNGSRLHPDTIRFLEELNILSLGVSIYGANTLSYEKMTSIPGSFLQFMKALEELSKSSLSVELRMPVTTVNFKEIPKARLIAENFGFYFSYTVDIEPGQNGSLEPLKWRLSPAQKMQILNEFDPESLTTEEEVAHPPEDFMDCACGRGEQFAVSPYGEMNYCVSFPYPKYDLRKGSVREGWEFLKKARERLGPNEHYECPTCEFKPFCRQGRNDAWLETGDASRCLPHFKDWARHEKNICETRWKKEAKAPFAAIS